MTKGLKDIHNEITSAKMENVDKAEFQDAYQLRFIGKNYAKFIADLPTETLLVPNTKWNNQPENQNSQNIFITGDNLPALKHLQNAYYNSVDVIYIDPPYNTGSDGFIYNDKFEYTDEQLKNILNLTDDEIKRLHTINGRSSHSAWLTFMYPRLKIASKLLKDTGVIFISLDRNEHANCKLLCDEIFGEGNYIDSIIWEKKTGAKGVPPQNMLVNVHEYVIAFQKKSGFRFLGKKRDESKFKNPDNDPRGPWRESNIKSTIKSSDKAFTITNPLTGQQYTNTWAFSEETLETMIKEGRILWKAGLPKQKEYLYEMRNKNQALKSTWGVFDPQSTTVYLKHIMPKVHFDNPKPLSFMKHLLEVSSSNNALILDFFAGSGTTAHAVMALNKEDGGNRKYIMVQLDEPAKKEAQDAGYRTIDAIALARIKYAAKELGDTSGFKHYYVREPNAQTLDKIIEFDPDKPALIAEDMAAELGGEEVVLTTWLVADGYKLTDNPKTIDIAGYTAYYCDNSVLYLIKQGWGKEQTQALLNLVGKNKLNVNTIICFGYSFTLEGMEELEINVKQSLNQVKVEKRY